MAETMTSLSVTEMQRSLRAQTFPKISLGGDQVLPDSEASPPAKQAREFRKRLAATMTSLSVTEIQCSLRAQTFLKTALGN
jgi:hypothetical protein